MRGRVLLQILLVNMMGLVDDLGPAWHTWLQSMAWSFRMLEGAPANTSLVPAGSNTYNFLSGQFFEELTQVVLGMCINGTNCELFCTQSGLAQKKVKKSGLWRRGG